MKKTGLIAFTAFSFLLFSCSNNNEKQTSDDQTETVMHDDHEGHANHDAAEVIELNNGEKWQVNDEMKPFLEQGVVLVSAYQAQADKNYSLLAEQLKEQNDLLIKSCTMEGKSHDELHKWLHPHLEMVKELKNAKSEDEANSIVTKLQGSYKVYAEHFQ